MDADRISVPRRRSRKFYQGVEVAEHDQSIDCAIARLRQALRVAALLRGAR